MLHKCVILSFIVTLVAGLNIDTEDRVHYEKVIEKFIENRCNTNGGPTAFDDLKNAGGTFWSCAVSTIMSDNVNTDQELLNFICSEFQPKFYSCLVSFLDAIEPCLDKEEKYLPNFASGWFNSTLEDHCKDGGAIILDHQHQLEDLKCEGTNYTNERVLEECFSTSAVIKDLETPDFVIRKDGLCAYLEQGNKCLLDILQESCQERVYKFVEFHLRPTEVWCSKYVNEVDN